MGVEKHDRGNCPLLKITNQRHTKIESELTKKRRRATTRTEKRS